MYPRRKASLATVRERSNFLLPGVYFDDNSLKGGMAKTIKTNNFGFLIADRTRLYTGCILHHKLNLIVFIIFILCQRIVIVSSQGAFPQLVNSAENKQIVTIPEIGTCGFNPSTGDLARSAYCRSSTLSQSTASCTQAFCIQTCPSRTDFPGSINLLPAVRGTCVTQDVTSVRPGSDFSSFAFIFRADASSDCYISPDNVPAIGSDGAFTIAGWFRPESTSDGVLIERRNPSNQLVYAVMVSGSSITFDYLTSTGARFLVIQHGFSVNQWQHFALQVFGTKASFFINGLEADGTAFDTRTLPGQILDVNNGQTRVGQRLSGSNQYVGRMQDFNFYQYTLTNREIEQLATATFPEVHVQSDCRCPDSHPRINPVESRNCIQNGVSDTTSDQMYRLDENAHPLTFANDGDLGSYWVSSFTDNLILQIDLENGQYQVFYVVLQFYSPQPTALTISKKTEDSLSWLPWQYFADDCQTQFGLQNNGPLTTSTSVNCIQFSTSTDIPYSKGNITFQLLSPEPVARPGYNDFYNTPALLDFVKASQIQIQMQGHYHASHPRHNYFGIEEVTISARCNCNGHATSCDLSQDPYVCNCVAASYTQGDQCSECLPLYNEKQFRHGDQVDAYNCRPCSCNNHTISCHYDITLDLYPTDHYRGGGGICDNCLHNTEGRYCDQCVSGYYRVAGRPLNVVDVCTACDCFTNGTIGGNIQCDTDGGQCDCKVFVTGRRCDQCITGFFNLQGSNDNGCEPCTCNAAGAVVGSTTCEVTGRCTCKANVIGDKCDRCNYGYYGLSASNPDGCTACSCDSNGASSVYCDPTNGQCQCSDTVQGHDCDECRDGFYGLSNVGCSLCDCDVAGTEPSTYCDKITGQCLCKVNAQGIRCDQCKSTYYNLQAGNTLGCNSCGCNPSGTIGASLACDSQSGQCLCKTYTVGQTCNVCTANYWGLNASNVDGCQPCSCDESGTQLSADSPIVCDQNTGQCTCIANRYGRRCDQCSSGTYLTPDSGRGCIQCNCHPMSSLSGSVCDAISGQCQCTDGGSGVTGRRCDSCLPGFYNFDDSTGRCSLCSCDPAGSVTTVTCDPNTGQCQCKDLVGGRQCDTCMPGSSNLDVSNPQGCSKAPSQQPSPSWVAISPYSLLLTWLPPDEPNGNILAYNLFRNGVLIYSGIYNDNWQGTQEYEDEGLTPYTQYTYYVHALNEAGTAQSPSVVARTPDAIPSGFDVLTVSNIGPRTAFFSWYKPTVISAPLEQYVLTSVSTSRPTPPTTHYSGSATSFQANDLIPFTNYTFRLTVCSTDGCGQGVGITVYTPQAAPEGLAPPRLIALTSTAVYVEWDHPTDANGIITHYELYMRGAPDAAGVTDPPETRIFYPAGWYNPRPTVMPGEDPVAEPTTNFTQENLDAFTEYEFRVTAMNQAGTGLSGWASVRTLEDSPLSISSPIVVGISSTDLNVSWTAPTSDQARGVIIQYKLYQFLISLDPFAPPESTTLIYAGPGHVTDYIVTDLDPYSSHEFRLEACNSVGCVTSARGRGNTLPDAPENQQAPSADGYNITTIEASWLPPIVQNGPAPSYSLQRMAASLNSPPPVVDMGSRFPGGGYYKFAGSLIPTSAYTGIELEFRVRRPPPYSQAVSSLLLFAVSTGEQEEFIVIQLRDGRPWFLFDPQGGAVGVTTTNDGGRTYDDDTWHHLKVTRDGTRGYITVDQVYTGSALSSTSSSIIGITDSVYIGGLPSDFSIIRTDSGNTEVIRASYVGCMKNVQIERQHIPTEVWQVLDWSDATQVYQVMPTWEGCPIDLDTGVHFLGGGYAAIPSDSLSSGINFNIQFEFRTLMDSAMLLYSHGDNGAYLSLQLVSQNIQLQVFGGAGISTLLSATSTTLCNGQWSTVTISRAGSILTLTVQGGTASTRDIGSGILRLTSDLFVGGIPLESDAAEAAGILDIQPGLGGCLQNMAMNSMIIDFQAQSTNILNVNLDGCPSISSTSSPCTMPTITNVYSGLARAAYDTGLDSFTEYMYRVVSTNEAGSTTSEWSRARAREGAPVGVSPPLDPESVTGYIIRVRWIRPSGNNGVLIQFILTAYNSDQPELANVVTVFNDTSSQEYIGNITGVIPFTNYQITLTACTEGGCTESLPVSIATKEEAPEGVSPPEALSATGSSITVGWDEPEHPNGLVRRYQLIMNNINLYQGTVRSFTVRGLSIYSGYDFYVTACTSIGCGQSPVVTLRTAQLPPSDVSPPMLYVRGPRLIEAQWMPPSEPNGVLERYVLFLSTESFFLGDEIYNSTALFLDFIITDLTPGTTYYVTLAACNDGGCTNSAPSVAVTHESTPEGVPPPTVTALSPYALHAEWTEPEQPNGAIVSYALYQNNIVIQNGTGMTRVISSLLPYSLHILRVEACTAKGCSIGPETRARTAEAAPVGSISLTVGVVTSRSVSAQWTEPAQPNGVIIYKVLFTGLYYISAETGNYNTYTTTRTLYNGTDVETPVLIDDLIPYTTYNVQVEGRNTKGSLTSNTEPATMPAGSPDGVFPPVLTALGPTSIQAVWTAPGRNNAPGQAVFQLLFRPTQQPGLQEQLFTSDTSVNSFIKSSLVPYTEYDFKLIASNGFGQTESDWTSTFTMEDTPGPIDPPMATVIDGTTLQVTWELADQPNGIITQTRIYQNNLYRDMVDGTVTEYVATDLEAFTDYVFRVEMCNSVSCTSSPNSITYTTPAASPSGQAPPTLLSETPTSIVITWEEPTNPNGVLTGYVLERRHQGFAAITTVVSVGRDGPMTYVDQSAAISPFTTYEYRLMVSNVAGSTTSQWAMVTTRAAPPGGIATPILTVTGPEAIHVSWSTPVQSNGDIISYTIKMPNPRVPVPYANVTSYEVSNLVPYTEYSVTIEACTIGGCSESNPARARTDPTFPQGQQPPTVTPITQNYISVFWDAPSRPNGPNIRYELARMKIREPLATGVVTGIGFWELITSTVDTSFQNTGLPTYSTYQYRVTVYNDYGSMISDPSPEVTTLAGVPQTGGSIIAEAIDHISVLVNWTTPSLQQLQGDVAEYFVVFSTASSAQESRGYPPGVSGAVINGLQPNSFYEFRIVIYNGAYNVSSNPVTVETLDGAPEGFDMPTIHVISSTSLRVIWTEPSMPNGDVQVYNVYVDNVNVVTLPSTTMSHVLFDLEPYTVYSIQVEVCTVYDCLLSPAAQTTTTEALPMGLVPPNLRVLGDDTIDINWAEPSQPNGIITKYALFRRALRPCDTGEETAEKTCHYIECGVSESICGSQCYSGNKVCCSGQLYDFQIGFECCESNYLTARINPTDVCCGGQFRPAQSNYQCCNGQYVVVLPGQICCADPDEDRVEIGAGDTCCGGIPYAADGPQVCCGGAFFDSQEGLCCDATYVSFEGTFYDGFNAHCCGSTIISVNQVCCGNGDNVRTYTLDPSKTCCGNAYETPDNLLCCTNSQGQEKAHVYVNSDEKLSANEQCCNLEVIPNTHSCCNGIGYNQATHICADRSTTAKGNCASGTICPVGQAFSAYCNRCDFDTNLKICGTVDEEYLDEIILPIAGAVCPSTLDTIYEGGPNAYTFLDQGLSPYITYQYSVAVYNSAGSFTSDYGNATTEEAIPSGVQPPSAIILPGVLDTILLNWNDPLYPNGIITSYIVRRDGIEIYRGIGNSFSDRNGIQPYQHYTYILSACTRIGCADSIRVVAATLQAKPEGVSNPVVTAVSSTTMSVTWVEPSVPNGVLQDYKIYLTGVEQPIYVTAPNRFEYLHRDLTPFTRYEYTLEACTEAGCTASNPVASMTLEGVPDGLSPPIHLVVSSSILELYWSEPELPNGDVSLYRLFRQDQLIYEGDGSVFMYIDSGLTPNTRYAYVLQAATSAGAANSSEYIVQTPENTPEGIPAPTLFVLSSTQIRATWAAPAFPNGIIAVYGVVVMSGSPDQFTRFSGQTLSYLLTGLDPYTQYNVRVQVCNDGGCGHGPKAYARTAEASPQDQEPPTLKATGPSVIEVSWQPPLKPNGIITSYQVYRRSYGSSQEFLSYVGSALSFINAAPELVAFTLYEYKVRAENSLGYIDSNWAAVRTLEAPPEGVPGPLELEAVSPYGVKVKWNEPATPNGVITAYRIEYRQVSNDPTLTYPVESAATVAGIIRETTFYGLVPYTSYQVRIVAINNAGEASGSWGDVTTAEGVPAAIQPFVVQKGSDGLYLILHWNEPGQVNGMILSYNIYQDIYLTEPIYTGLLREFVFRRLTPYTEYTLILEACTGAGCGRGDPQTIVTAAVLPENQGAPTIEFVNATQVTLSWVPPISANGPITRYDILRRSSTTNQRRKRDTDDSSFTQTNVVYVEYNTDDDYYTFTDSQLQPYTLYEYKIITYNSIGSTDSGWVSIQTDQAAPTTVNPPSINFILDNPTSLIIQWTEPEEPNGVIQVYVLERNETSPFTFPAEFSKIYNDTGLEAYTVYYYTIKACTACCCTTSDRTFIRTLEAAPVFVDSPVPVTISSTAIQVSWSVPSLRYGEIIRYELKVDGQEQYRGLDLQTVVNSLTPYQEYTFTVVACTSGGCTESVPSNARPYEAPPQQMNSPSLRVLSATAVEASWTEPLYPNGEIINYELRRDGRLVYSGLSLIFPDFGDGGRGLTPGQEYSYVVAAFNREGTAVSSPATITTSSSSPAGLSPPIATALSSTSISATWVPPLYPNGDILNYTLYLDGSPAFSGVQFSHVVRNLFYFTLYEFRIEACTESGCALSERTTTRTLEHPPSSQLAPSLTPLADSIGIASGISVEWGPPQQPNGIILYYQLQRRQVFRTSGGRGETFLLQNGTSMSYIDEDQTLEPNMEYEYRVTSFNTAGQATSSWAVVRMLEAPPEGLDPPKFSLITSTSLLVNIQEPAKPNGIITSYAVMRNSTELSRTTSSSYSDEDLEPFTYYAYSVKACTSRGCTTSEPGYVQTLQSVPLGLAAPIIVQEGVDFIKVSWQDPMETNGIIERYELNSRPACPLTLQPFPQPCTEVGFSQSYQGTSTNYTLSNLKPYTSYEFQAFAYNSEGKAESPLVLGNTIASAPVYVSDLTIYNNGSNLMIVWTNSFILNSKLIEYVLTENGDKVYSGVASSVERPLTAKLYEFLVTCRTTTGEASSPGSLYDANNINGASTGDETEDWYSSVWFLSLVVLFIVILLFVAIAACLNRMGTRKPYERERQPLPPRQKRGMLIPSFNNCNYAHSESLMDPIPQAISRSVSQRSLSASLKGYNNPAFVGMPPQTPRSRRGSQILDEKHMFKFDDEDDDAGWDNQLADSGLYDDDNMTHVSQPYSYTKEQTMFTDTHL